MDETCHHSAGSSQAMPRPARRSSAGAIVPLRLMVLPERKPVEVTQPVVLIGRHTDTDLRLAYPQVSRRHCRLMFEDGGWRVFDLDSLNGVYVNGERVDDAALCEGDEVRVGEATLLVTRAPAMKRPDVQVLRSISEALAE